MTARRTALALTLIAALSACARVPVEEAVMAEPSPILDAGPNRAEAPCDAGSGPDDGIGGTGCTPALD